MRILRCLSEAIIILADVEDITAKTGNFKKFPVFVKMLLTALKQESESVCIDLLTYEDLELLKSRRGRSTQPESAKPVLTGNKRYLILTYAAEFDRVHYPLPLLYEETPDAAHFKTIIKALRREVDAAHQALQCRTEDETTSALREENAQLQQQLRVLRSKANDPSLQQKDLQKEVKHVSSFCL